MAREKDYISNKEYDEALRRFHNGLDDFTGHIEYKESIIESYNHNPRVVEEYLTEGERYTILDSCLLYTSDAADE